VVLSTATGRNLEKDHAVCPADLNHIGIPGAGGDTADITLLDEGVDESIPARFTDLVGITVITGTRSAGL